MALIDFFLKLLHFKVQGVEALQIKDNEGIYTPGKITRIWLEHEDKQDTSSPFNFYIQFKPENLEEADPNILIVEEDEFKRILDETTELTLFDTTNNAEIIKIPLKRNSKLYIKRAAVLQSKNHLTDMELEQIDFSNLLFVITFKINDKVSVEYSHVFSKEDEVVEDDIRMLYKGDEGITPIIKVLKEEPENVPDAESEPVEAFVSMNFWLSKVGVSFVLISAITVVFFVLPSIWTFYRIFVGK